MTSFYINIPPVGSGGGGAGVDSFNGRTGAVLPVSGDYNADQITFDNSGTSIVATTSGDALRELDSELSALDLSTIPGTLDPERVESPYYEYDEGVVFTTDATTALAFSETFSEDLMVTYSITVNAIQYAGISGTYGTANAWKRTIKVKSISGTASASRVQSDFTEREDKDWNLSIYVTGNTFRIDFTGDTDNSVKWVYQITKVITTIA